MPSILRVDSKTKIAQKNERKIKNSVDAHVRTLPTSLCSQSQLLLGRMLKSLSSYAANAAERAASAASNAKKIASEVFHSVLSFATKCCLENDNSQ